MDERNTYRLYPIVFLACLDHLVARFAMPLSSAAGRHFVSWGRAHFGETEAKGGAVECFVNGDAAGSFCSEWASAAIIRLWMSGDLHFQIMCGDLVDVRGLEPLTSSLRTRRSPN